MKQIIPIIAVVLLALGIAWQPAGACTSMLVSASASATGRPLMWKHRDTGTEHNFVDRVEAKGGRLGYVALYDGGDSLLTQAWMGMNDAGFAIMNTASYNLQPDTARLKDNEGYLMSVALSTCRTLKDFESLIRNLRKPLGVEANFGVMDATGGLAYYEVNDHEMRRYNVADAPSGYLIRTNFSVSGEKGGGYGYIRYNDLMDIIRPEAEARKISPVTLTEKASRSFWHSLMKHDFEADTCTWVVDQDFIPRNSSSASLVIEGVNPDQSVSDMVMWTMLGYPPCSVALPVRLTSVPETLSPTADGYRSPWCNQVVQLKHAAFPIEVGNGKHYINMAYLRPVIKRQRANSLKMYRNHYGDAIDYGFAIE